MTEYYIWLQAVLGYGSAKLNAVLREFGSPAALFESSAEQIVKSGIFMSDEIKKINKIPLEYAVGILENCNKIGCRVITPDMEEYPARLLNIIDPPCAVYVMGKFPDFDDEAAVSMVGSRKPTESGRKAAVSLAARLARAGMVIVSGGALGIDYCSHMGALSAGGVTVCVMPCGVDINYPSQNSEMRRNVRKKGCLISEMPPGTGVSKGAFHIRNRIISALSLGTVIIEAGEKSGTLITANSAIDQGRDVFVIPGAVDSPQYAGSNRLISDGARPLLSVLDILDEYALNYPHKLNVRQVGEPFSDEILSGIAAALGRTEVSPSLRRGNPSRKAAPQTRKTVKATVRPPAKREKRMINVGEVSDDAAKVYDLFSGDAVSADFLIAAGKLESDTVLAALTELEVFGYIESLPGGRYKIAD